MGKDHWKQIEYLYMSKEDSEDDHSNNHTPFRRSKSRADINVLAMIRLHLYQVYFFRVK